MNKPVYGFSRNRIIAASVIFVIATVLMAWAGVNMISYLQGVAVGAVAAIVIIWGFMRLRKKT
jgi:hypothetical protein